MTKPSLAERRRELVERCAEERVGLAYEVQSLRQSLRPSNALGHPVAGYVVEHKKLVLGVAAAGLGLVLARPKRLVRLAGAILSGWRTARGVLGVLGELRRRG